jgi:hypothetical protein
MIIAKKAIPRRTVLRGLGTSIALPLLDAMVPALAAARQAPAPVMRVGYIYLPVGRIMDKWTPKAEGTGFPFSQTLAPLEPFRDQVLVLSGLNIAAADQRPGESGGSHSRACAAFLTGVHPAPGKPLGISVDQVIAKKWGELTPFGSLELGLDASDIPIGSEGAYAGYYQSTIAWRSATTPLPTEYNPRKVFERLFGDGDSNDTTARLERIQQQRSVLDSITDRVGRLSRKLAADDRVKLGEYMEGIRDVERRMQIADARTTSGELPQVGRPQGVPETYSEHARLMFDLQLLAWQSDLTRVTTLMMGHEGTNRTHKDTIGETDGHHALSHHKGNPQAIASVEKIDLLQSRLFAYFLDRLRSTREGAGSLLDHSMVVFGASLSDGNQHLHRDVPMVIAGGGCGKIKGGRHLRYDGAPLSNLHLAMLDLSGVQQDLYLGPGSDATERLEGLTV